MTANVVKQTQSETVWTPEKRIQFRIGMIRLWMNECNQKNEWGRRLYTIFDVYLRSLQRQQVATKPGKVEYNQMKSAIESIHELISELEDEEMESLYGWHYGQKVTNSAQGMLATLLAIRGELLQEISDLVTN